MFSLVKTLSQQKHHACSTAQQLSLSLSAYSPEMKGLLRADLEFDCEEVEAGEEEEESIEEAEEEETVLLRPLGVVGIEDDSP